MLFIRVWCCRARVWRASARTPTSTRRGSVSSSSRRRSECPGFTLLNVEFCLTSQTKLVTMKLEYGCFVAALCQLKCIDDDNEWKMRMSPSWLLRLYPQLDYYKLWQQQYAVWMQCNDAGSGFDKCVPVQIMREADSRNTFCSEAILWLSIRSTLRGQNIMFCKYLLCNLIKKC